MGTEPRFFSLLASYYLFFKKLGGAVLLTKKLNQGPMLSHYSNNRVQNFVTLDKFGLIEDMK